MGFYKIVSFLLLAASLSSCSDSRKLDKIGGNAQLNSPRYIIGVPQGAAAMHAVEKLFPKATIKYYDSLANAYIAVKTGRIDAFAFDKHSLEYVVLTNPDLALMPEKIAEESIVVGAPKKNAALIKKVNEFIRAYRADGTYMAMYARWIKRKDHTMPELPVPAEAEMSLVVGTEGLDAPMNYFGPDGKLTGFDMEFIKRLAFFLKAKVEMKTMTFDALIPGAETGKIDLLIANLNGTPECAKVMELSDKYVDSEISFIVRKDRLANQAASGRFAAFENKKIASLTGTVFDKLIDKAVPNVDHVYFNDYGSMIEALRGGKVEAVGVDLPVGLMYKGQFEDLELYPAKICEDQLGFAVSKGDKLGREISEVFEKFKADGTMKRLADKWFSGKSPRLNIDDFRRPGYDGGKGAIRFGVDDSTAPLCYSGDDGSALGFDVELMVRAAYALNMKIEVIQMPFGSLLGALKTGKCDIVGGAMSITDERKKSVDFTIPYFDSGIMLLTRKAHAEDDVAVNSLEQLNGQNVGVLSGSKFDKLLLTKAPRAIPEYFNQYSDCIAALRAGKIKGFVIDEPVGMMVAGKNPDLRRLPEMLAVDQYAFIFGKDKTALRDEFNQQLSQMRESGLLGKLRDKWMTPGPGCELARYPNDGKRGVLKMIASPEAEPFSFLDADGKLVGYEIEIAYQVAGKMGYALEPLAADYTGFIAAVSSGKVDMGASIVSITEERKKSVLFSDPDYEGGVVVMTLRPAAAAPAAPGFLHRLRESFHRTFILEDRYKLILDGLWTTIVISVASAVFGTLLGFVVCLMRRSRNLALNLTARTFIVVVQGTPMVVLLMILYYVVFGSININAVLVAIIGFGLNFAAYVSEMMRSSFEAVDIGQREASTALGFNKCQTFLHVTFPQAAKYIIPVYRGEFISMLKGTAIVGYIAIQDLTKMSDIIRSRTYEAFFPLIATAVIYFIIAYVMIMLLKLLEAKIDPKRRPRIVRGVISK